MSHATTPSPDGDQLPAADEATDDLTLVSVLDRHHRVRPDHCAIRCGETALSFSEFRSRSLGIALELRRGGIGEGDRVAFLGLESPDYYATFLACASTGAVLVPINFRLTPREIDHILTDSASRVLLVDPELRESVSRGPDRHPGLLVMSTAELDPARPGTEQNGSATDVTLDSTGPTVSARPDDPLVQLYTSGTTGLPKGVVLAHRSFFAISAALRRAGSDWIDWSAEDVSLVGIPGFHIGGLWWFTQGFTAGVTAVILPRFDASLAVAEIRRTGVSTLCVVPSMLDMMLSEPGVDESTFGTVRKLVYGGSPISASLLERFSALAGCDLVQIYGLTETGNTALCLTPEDHRRGAGLRGAAGRPYPGVRVRVVDRRGHALPTGATGEICLHTPARMIGYWNRPEATAETLVDGWIHTGDAGHVDADGLVHVSDRIKDLIISGGENLSPAEIEGVLRSHPGVADAAVIGIPDERSGEAAHAVVVAGTDPAPSTRSLFLHCREHLAAFKIPRSFEWVDYLPRNPSGKVLRRALREPHWSGHDRRVH